MVTSTNGRRWIIPKGMIDPGHTAGEAALQEAWEEAGLVGTLHAEPVGSYAYEKWGGTYLDTVFVMNVTDALDEYPERNARDREWLSPVEAIERIQEPGLRDIIAHVFGFEDAEMLLRSVED